MTPQLQTYQVRVQMKQTVNAKFNCTLVEGQTYLATPLDNGYFSVRYAQNVYITVGQESLTVI